MSLATGEFDAVAVGVAIGADCGTLADARGVGLAFGTSKRPRRCDGAGETIGDEIADAVAVGATVTAR